MSHSHIAVEQLLKQMEIWEPGKHRREARPLWLTALIEETAELFEPLTGIARVGFDCRMQDETAIVRMYLGTTEIVGGSRDGQQQPMSFEVNLDRLRSRFDEVDEFSWSVFPENARDIEEAQAYVTISGVIDAHRVRFHLFATAPSDAGPGMRVYQDGRVEPA